MIGEKIKVGIQGYHGSFHDIAARSFFGDQNIETIGASSFDKLAILVSNESVDVALMAIENSIAGTILQNYRILREYGFWVNGEIYLPISHHLFGCQGSCLNTIKQVYSHPMALNQCLSFLGQYQDWKLVETEDTALSAANIAQWDKKSKACIASEQAGKLFSLNCLAKEIQTNKNNYTRFFVVHRRRQNVVENVNKASIYIRIPDQKSQLLKVLLAIDKHNLNLSKLQSFPVLGSFREYFFHLDIEFNHINEYVGLSEDLKHFTFEFEELGLYKRSNASSILSTLNC